MTTQKSRPRIVVLTPVKNEAWILRPFLECASLWADNIIIADQSSTDGSRELAQTFPKVTVINNPSHTYCEVERQRLLIEAARHLPGPCLLMALDADEIMSANILDEPEWIAAMEMPTGTVLELAKVDLWSSPERYYLHSAEDRQAWLPFGYLDDGTPHTGAVIHTARLPERSDAPRFRLHNVVLLHFSRCNKLRSESKDRWYRCFERVTFPRKPIVTIHRLYDWYERLEERFVIRPSPAMWFSKYTEVGSALRDLGCETTTTFWWDWDILRMFRQHGTEPFRLLDIWSFDWESLRLAGIASGVAGLPETTIVVPQDVRARLIRAILQKSARFRMHRYVDGVLRRFDRLFG